VVILAAAALANDETGRLVARVAVLGRYPGRRLEPGLAVGETLDVEKLAQTAQEFRRILAAAGFLWAEVRWDTVTAPGGVEVTYHVSAGQRARIAGWNCVGNEHIPEAIISGVLPRRGAIMDQEVLARARGQLLSLYDRNGFPFARVSAPAVRDSGGWVYPTILVDEGPQVRLDFLEFAGTKSLRPALLRRVTRFQAGVDYSARVLQLWQHNLEKTGWVQVDSTELVAKGSSYGVRFWLTEARNSFISGALGYQAEEGRFTGMVRLRFLNLLGTGRRFNAGWRSALSRTTYDLSYTEPWVLGSMASVTGTIQQLVIDTSYSQVNLVLSGTVVAGAVDFLLEAGYDRVIVSASVGNSQTLWAGTGFAFDGRDQPLNPRRGGLLVVKTRLGERQGQDSTTGIVGRVEVGLEQNQLLRTNLVWVNRVEGRMVSATTALSEPELYCLGGTQSVRGYREGRFVSARIVWLNSELWYCFNRAARVYPFLDLGLFQSQTDRKWCWTPAYGLGGRWETRVGEFGVAYGVAFPDDPLRGKVHISYEGGF